ncbi:MAG TPA: SGNH/GDSL hydrolase family protein, partial [Candidatus Dietzia merdigallinarum]|nr:SGNH/GDSL hydrolase family protein [Candidatus Dietzia merdigallinarum]
MSETDDPARRLVVSLALVAVGTVGAYRGAYEVLAQQARIARKVIPKPTDRAFDGDGLYRPGAEFPEPWRPGMDCDIHMMVFGDSLAAGLGADSAADMPGVLLARGLAEESGQNVRLSIKAIVGATSKGLPGQVEAMQIAQGRPDISVILIGGNDITARNAIGPSARRVGDAVAALREGGSEVVVGTCPDLGIIKPVPQPLRSVLATLSRRLAAAQAVQVRKAGGVPVSLVETLAPEFYKRGESLFSPDRFHPNSAGYELAAGLLLPSVCVALGVWDELPDDAEKAPEDAIDAGDAADAAEALAEAALEGAPEGEDTA